MKKSAEAGVNRENFSVERDEQYSNVDGVEKGTKFSVNQFHLFYLLF
jgi:hypothetical protein